MEVVVAATVTVSIAGVSYAAVNVADLSRTVRATASTASCRTLDVAVFAYMENHGTIPATVTDLRSYVRGDVAAYRIVHGAVRGPGCAAGN